MGIISNSTENRKWSWKFCHKELPSTRSPHRFQEGSLTGLTTANTPTNTDASVARAADLGNERLAACFREAGKLPGRTSTCPGRWHHNQGLKDYRIYVTSHTLYQKRLFRVSQVKGRHCAELIASNDPTEGQNMCIFRCLKSNGKRT